jgi:hypothetical protein
MRRVFISYRRASGSMTARAIASELARRDCSVFLDVEGLRQGDVREAIATEIRSATDFIPILSPGSLDTTHAEEDWLTFEVNCALAARVNIVPVLVEGFEWSKAPSSELKALLSKYNSIGLSHEYFSAGIDRLGQFLSIGARSSSTPRLMGATPSATTIPGNTLDRITPDENPGSFDFLSKAVRAVPTRAYALLVSAALLGLGGLFLVRPLNPTPPARNTGGVSATMPAPTKHIDPEIPSNILRKSEARAILLSKKYRDALLARFRPSGWVISDGNYRGEDAWTQSQVLAAILSGSIPRDRTQVVNDGLRVLAKARQGIGWKSDLRDFHIVEPALFGFLASCIAPKRGIVVGDSADFWHATQVYSDELGRWREAPTKHDAPSVYATALAALSILECHESAVASTRIEQSLAWLYGSQVPQKTFPAWKAEPMAASPMKGVTAFVTFVLMRANRNLRIPEANIDFTHSVPEMLVGLAASLTDFSISDAYVFAAAEPGKTPFSHSVRFLRTPWAIACAFEWLRHHRSADEHSLEIVARTLEDGLSTMDQQDLVETQSWQLADYLLALNVSTDAGEITPTPGPL